MSALQCFNLYSIILISYIKKTVFNQHLVKKPETTYQATPILHCYIVLFFEHCKWYKLNIFSEKCPWMSEYLSAWFVLLMFWWHHAHELHGRIISAWSDSSLQSFLGCYILLGFLRLQGPLLTFCGVEVRGLRRKVHDSRTRGSSSKSWTALRYVKGLWVKVIWLVAWKCCLPFCDRDKLTKHHHETRLSTHQKACCPLFWTIQHYNTHISKRSFMHLASISPL